MKTYLLVSTYELIAYISATDGRKWAHMLTNELKKSPLASNVFLGFILAGLEKLVEIDFACPCDPKFNALFVSAYFIVPAVIASVLMLIAQECKRHSCQDWENLVLFGTVPATMWITLLFLDGQYYACAMTNWSGRFVNADKASPEKWCEPDSDPSSQEKLKQTQKWYFHSQVWNKLQIVKNYILQKNLCYLTVLMTVTFVLWFRESDL